MLIEIKESLLKQIEALNDKDFYLIESKLNILKTNPYRFKRLKTKIPLWSLRIGLSGVSSRLIYTIDGQKVIALFIMRRKEGYKQIEEKATRTLDQ